MAGTFKKTKVYTQTIAGTPRYIPGGTARTGTVTTTIGSKYVVGVGTSFCDDVQVGDLLILDTDYKVYVKAVDSDTSLRLHEEAVKAKAGVNFTTEEYNTLEFHAVFSAAGTIETGAWATDVAWKMKNDYGIESVLFGGTGTITYLQPAPVKP